MMVFCRAAPGFVRVCLEYKTLKDHANEKEHIYEKEFSHETRWEFENEHEFVRNAMENKLRNNIMNLGGRKSS